MSGGWWYDAGRWIVNMWQIISRSTRSPNHILDSSCLLNASMLYNIMVVSERNHTLFIFRNNKTMKFRRRSHRSRRFNIILIYIMLCTYSLLVGQLTLLLWTDWVVSLCKYNFFIQSVHEGLERANDRSFCSTKLYRPCLLYGKRILYIHIRKNLFLNSLVYLNVFML